MTLFFLILLGVSLGIFFYQRSRKNKKPILKPSLPLAPETAENSSLPKSEPQFSKSEPPPVPTPVMPTPPPAPPMPIPEAQNPIALRMAEIAEELKEPELSEPKKEFLPPTGNPPLEPPGNLPVG